MSGDTLQAARFWGAAMLFAVLLPSPENAQAEEKKPEPVRSPAFDRMVVKFEPSFLDSFGQTELLRFESNGTFWYRAERRPAHGNVPAQDGAVFDHKLPPERIERLNKLLKDTDWLTAKGGEGPATHTDAGTTTLLLHRDGKRVSVQCHGQRPEPYAALLRELEGLALQERRIYLHDWVSGKEGTAAWQVIGHEMDGLRGGPYAKSPYNIDYQRYLPIAQRIIHDFYSQQDDELIPAVRLVAHFKSKAELVYLHRMAHDRSSPVRIEVARALGRIHEKKSLPVLVEMMAAGASRSEIGLELIRWGGNATPEIVNLIALSSDDRLTERERVVGEDMIRAYLDNRDKLKAPIDPRVIEAVSKALDSANPEKSIRTTYHQEFLQKFATDSPTGA